ncbi:MAG: hypothetical protein HY611_09555, partial [Elusimicrobia bacterium]|nr:hypothetical protein [Elusimicrobiota bacterium]
LTTDGVSIDADAVYTSQGANYIRANKAGTIELQNAAGTRRIDAVGWSNTSAFSVPQLYEETSGSACQLGGAPGYVVTADGLAAGNQIVRMSSAGAVNSNYGNAYDTDDNYCNFYFNEGSGTYWLRSPRNKSTTKTMISGRPASTGSLDLAVSASDGLSTAETADNYTKTVTGGLYTKTCPDYGFTLSQVATGTWTVNVFAGSFTQEFTGVSVSASGTTVIPNASTTPAWSQSGAYVARLSTAATEGFIRGYVYDAVSLTALSGITVTAGGVSKTSGSNGYFSLTVTSGTQTATANPNNLSNPSYVSSVKDASVSTGGTSWLYFYLSKGGTFKGYVTSGSSPLPNITVVATKDNNQAGQGTSDSSGYFYIYDLSTGTFELTTIVDPSNTTSPATIDADIVASQTVSVGTFTVTGSYGTIQGSVTKGGAAITTGVLIVASTSSISVTPPAIYASSSAAKTVYYSVTSRSDGTYSLEVRGSSSLTYYMSAHYPTVGDTSTSTSRQTLSGISVTSGNTVTGKNFAF